MLNDYSVKLCVCVRKNKTAGCLIVRKISFYLVFSPFFTTFVS